MRFLHDIMTPEKVTTITLQSGAVAIQFATEGVIVASDERGKAFVAAAPQALRPPGR